MPQKKSLNAMLAYAIPVFLMVQTHALIAYAPLKFILYALCTLVYGAYIVRWAKGEIKRRQPMLLCALIMFALLGVITVMFGGTSGYVSDWLSGFALMLMLDMGLQREKRAVLNGFSAALSLWTVLHLLSLIAFPDGLIAPSAENGFAAGWLLGSRVFYFRTVFPALAFEIIRAQVLCGKWTVRTWGMLAIAALTVVLQGGGTAIIGFAVLTTMLLFFNRRALPRYATPLVMAALSVLLFAGIYFFEIQNLFSPLIGGVLGKDMTFSGRTQAWTAAVELIKKNPVTGVGLLPVAYKKQFLGYSHTHNQLLELWLHGGILTVAAYAVLIVLAARQTLAYRRFPAVKTAAILLMTFILMGTVEIFHNDPIYYALFVLVSRADCLAEGKKLPRISVLTRLKRDLKK